MSSKGIKQIDSEQGYFVPLSSMVGIIYNITPGSGAGGAATTPTFATAAWASTSAVYGSAGNVYLSSINAIGKGGLLRDMGRTVVSAGRTFRKVQLVVQSVSTGGVQGVIASAAPFEDFLTGYIELGFGAGVPAPVAQFGR